MRRSTMIGLYIVGCYWSDSPFELRISKDTAGFDSPRRGLRLCVSLVS